MTEIRAEYPFQISYEDARLPGSWVQLRAESAQELGEAYVQLEAALDGALGKLVTDPEGPAQEVPRPGQPSAQGSDSVAELPIEALKALMDQGKQIPCSCNAGWWDNRQSKKNPRAPDFKCKKDATHGVWLTPRPA